MKKKQRGGKKRKKPKQIEQGPIWVRRPNDDLLAVAYRIESGGTITEYWAILQGEVLDPGSSVWTCVEFQNPDSDPPGAPTPTQTQFKKWAENCMYDSHGNIPALDYYEHSVTTFT